MKNFIFSLKSLAYSIVMVLSLMISYSSYACDGHHHAIDIRQAWARANVAENGNSAIFMDISNHSKKADKLVKVITDIAETVELHISKKVGNVHKMEPISSISLPRGKTVSLKPGGLHIMLLSLKKPLEEGETIKATLIFEHSPSQDLEIPVLKKADSNSKECPCHAH